MLHVSVPGPWPSLVQVAPPRLDPSHCSPGSILPFPHEGPPPAPPMPPAPPVDPLEELSALDELLDEPLELDVEVEEDALVAPPDPAGAPPGPASPPASPFAQAAAPAKRQIRLASHRVLLMVEKWSGDAGRGSPIDTAPGSVPREPRIKRCAVP